jgi:hypothetical protein
MSATSDHALGAHLPYDQGRANKIMCHLDSISCEECGAEIVRVRQRIAERR